MAYPPPQMFSSFTIDTSLSSKRPNYLSSLNSEEGSDTKKKRSCESKLGRRKMWFMHVIDEEEKELGRQQAPGSCPYCGGKVEAKDVEIQWRLCFLPMCFKVKRKYSCTSCSKRLELFL